MSFQTFNHINKYQSDRGSVVTIGTFDGVHQGHQKILDRVVHRATSDGLTSVLLTFFPHPRMVLQPLHDLKLINTIQERVDLVAARGVENVIIHPFSKEFSRTTAREYVEDILVQQLKAKVVIIGYDHRFGRNRSASIVELREFGKELGFEIVEISKKEVEEVAVSSTKVRTAIESGDVTTASEYLGRDFTLKGTVVSGRKMGRSLGYPTANLQVEETYKIVPRPGVYITTAQIQGKKYYGMTNVGVNPTVTDTMKQTIETYFLDLDQNLYGVTLELSFHERLRDEVKFDSVADLVHAMQHDEIKTRRYAQQMG
jgi:riboflavin kinase/FMN adenylyltransferase